MKIIITGGHHSSALPVISRLKEQEEAHNISNLEIFWIGHKYSMKGDKNPTLEYREITDLGISFYNLRAGKLYKTYNIGRLLKVPLGFFHSLYLLIKIRPDIILSFGGYIAAPVILAGYVLKIPSLTHEQTLTAGYSNKLISHFVRKVMISWEESRKYFPKGKVVFTGIPLRRSVFKVISDSFKFDNNLPVVFILAGKTGSHMINENVEQSLKELLNFCNVIHQCGDNSVYEDFNKLEERYEKIKSFVKGKYILRKFILENEIGEAYLKSDLVVSRAGAHTVAEILALKKPSLLIPIPWVSHNEQYKNAEMVKNNGLAEILDQKDLNPNILLEKIKYCLDRKDNFVLKDDKVLKFLKENPADLIVDEIIKVFKIKKR